jgi:hypothetical protein
VVASVVTDVAANRLWVLLAYGQRPIGVALERSLVETPTSRSNARRSEQSFGSESSIKSSIPTAYWSFCKLLQQEKPRFARLLQSPLADSNRRPPPYHGSLGASRAYTRDHPRHSFSCKPSHSMDWMRRETVARVVSDVSVFCPPLVARLDNGGSARRRDVTLPRDLRLLALSFRGALPVTPLRLDEAAKPAAARRIP